MKNPQAFRVENLLQPSSQTGVRGLSEPDPISRFPVHVEQLFVRFQSNYGHVWSSQFPSDEMTEAALAEWSSALAGFSAERIRKVAEHCFQSKTMPPTLPEFLRLCRPQMREHGLPDPEAAYQEACTKSHEPNSPAMRWSHPAVYHAGRQAGWHDLHCGLTGVKNKFEKAYRGLCQRVMNGETLSLPVVSASALEHKAGTKTRTEQEKQTAQAWLGKMRSRLRQSGNAGGKHGCA